jgi:hypothetical protein
MRDVFFDGVEQVIPFHFSSSSRDTLIASAIFIAVFARTYFLMRSHHGWTLLGTIMCGVLVPLMIVQGALLVALVIMSGRWDFLLLNYNGALIGATVGLALGFDAEMSLAFRAFAYNAAVFFIMALTSLALGGAF